MADHVHGDHHHPAHSHAHPADHGHQPGAGRLSDVPMAASSALSLLTAGFGLRAALAGVLVMILWAVTGWALVP